jgi:Fur family ferric uptake transcriptional regulator
VPSASLSVQSRVETQFRAKGLKLTRQRRLIATIMSKAKGYPDFDELYRRVAERNPCVSRATVYRTLKLFEREGFVERHIFLEGHSRF